MSVTDKVKKLYEEDVQRQIVIEAADILRGFQKKVRKSNSRMQGLIADKVLDKIDPELAEIIRAGARVVANTEKVFAAEKSFQEFLGGTKDS